MSNAISDFRRSKNLTLEQFGHLVGVQKAAVSKWEKGIAGPSPALAIEIEKATNGQLSRWDVRPDLWDAPQSEVSI